MIIEICVGVISIAFVVLVVFLAVTLCKVIETLKKAKRMMANLDDISEESLKLIKASNDLVSDFKEKSEALNFFFRPLAKFSKKKTESKHHRNYDKIAEIINFAADSIVLFNKLKRKH
jgi:uncharacterized protein YoxC